MEYWKNSVLFAIALLAMIALVGSAAAQQPDLVVNSIASNCGGYIFANESNEITAIIENNGTADAGAFNVSFVILPLFHSFAR